MFTFEHHLINIFFCFPVESDLTRRLSTNNEFKGNVLKDGYVITENDKFVHSFNEHKLRDCRLGSVKVQ